MEGNAGIIVILLSRSLKLYCSICVLVDEIIFGPVPSATIDVSMLPLAALMDYAILAVEFTV